MKRAEQHSWGPYILIAVLFVILGLSWADGWRAKSEARKHEARAIKAEADCRELQGELDDMKASPIGYLLLYRRATIARFSMIEPRWDEIMEAIWSASQKWGVPAEITAAKIERESMFRPDAIGQSGEMGLMQVLPPAWPSFDTKRGFEISYNVDFGARIFASCMKTEKGDIRKALRRYNGMGELPTGVLPYADRVLSGKIMGGGK